MHSVKLYKKLCVFQRFLEKTIEVRIKLLFTIRLRNAVIWQTMKWWVTKTMN